MFRILISLLLTGTAYGQTSQSTLDAAKAASQSFSKVKNQTSNSNLSLCVNQGGTEKCQVVINGATPSAVVIGPSSGQAGKLEVQDGTIKIGNATIAGRAGFYIDQTLNNTGSCSGICVDTGVGTNATTFGFISGSGGCVAAWRNDAPITCADTTSGVKNCLCIGWHN